MPRGRPQPLLTERKLHPAAPRAPRVGLSALRKILAPQPFNPATLAGRTVAVDADNLVWSFATALAATGNWTTGPDGRSNAHLQGLVARLRLYAQWGARSVWIFDGAQPGLKEATLVARAERIEAARVAGDAQAAIEVTADDLAECRALLAALGIPAMVAPGESDAQCARLVADGKAWAAVTQDWDIALFGAPRALRNLSGSKTRAPEILDLAGSLAAAALTREQLVDAAILIGTDYNEGLQGIGPVKAVKLVKKHGSLEAALRALGASMPEAAEVRSIFLEHPVDVGYAPRFSAPDAEKARALLAARGISETKAAALVEDLARLHR